MSKKSVAHQKKVDESVRILNTTTGVIVPRAMILAGFPKKDIANDTVRRMIRCCLEALKAKQTNDLDLWLDSWETFVVEYGFATINKDGSLHFTEDRLEQRQSRQT
jgi:hypothetical protein